MIHTNTSKILTGWSVQLYLDLIIVLRHQAGGEALSSEVSNFLRHSKSIHCVFSVNAEKIRCQHDSNVAGAHFVEIFIHHNNSLQDKHAHADARTKTKKLGC